MIAAIDQFFEASAVPMTRPPAYGPLHIIFTVVGFALSVFLAWKLRKVSEKSFHRILFGVGFVLFLSEIFKQFFYFFAMCDNTYCWAEFPFQLCSIPMYLCMIVPFMKESKLRRNLYSFMVLYNLLGGAISFAEPSGLLHEYWFLTIHALIWHMSLVFIGLFICFTKRGGNQIGDYRGATCTFLCFSAVAFVLNFLVQTFAHEHMNMFFVGPGNSPLAVFSLFSEWFGWYVNTFIYLFAVSLGAYLIYLLIYYLHNKSMPRRQKTAAA